MITIQPLNTFSLRIIFASFAFLPLLWFLKSLRGKWFSFFSLSSLFSRAFGHFRLPPFVGFSVFCFAVRIRRKPYNHSDTPEATTKMSSSYISSISWIVIPHQVKDIAKKIIFANSIFFWLNLLEKQLASQVCFLLIVGNLSWNLFK